MQVTRNRWSRSFLRRILLLLKAPQACFFSCEQTAPYLHLLTFSSQSLVPRRTVRISENTEKVLIRVAPGSYVLESNFTQTISILDNDVPVVTVHPSDSTAAEQGPETGSFTVIRNNPADINVTISLAFTGGGGATPEATRDGDYTLPIRLQNSLVIPAGTDRVTTIVTPIDDSVSESLESANILIAPNAAYQVGDPGSVAIFIVDNDSP